MGSGVPCKGWHARDPATVPRPCDAFWTSWMPILFVFRRPKWPVSIRESRISTFLFLLLTFASCSTSFHFSVYRYLESCPYTHLKVLIPFPFKPPPQLEPFPLLFCFPSWNPHAQFPAHSTAPTPCLEFSPSTPPRQIPQFSIPAPLSNSHCQHSSTRPHIT